MKGMLALKNYLFPKFLQGMTVEALADYCLEAGKPTRYHVTHKMLETMA